MREPLRDKERLEHMLRAIDTITRGKTGRTLDDILADPIIYYGFVKHVEIIGEACYKLSRDFRNKHSEVDWDIIEGMRHVLVHDYYQIRPEQLWETIQYDIPKLRPIIDSLIKQLSFRPKF